MEVGYNLTLNNFNQNNKSKGNIIFNQNKSDIETFIKNNIFKNGAIDGTKLQEEWFPQINADIFLSHSHKDEELAKSFAGWIKENFELNVFIDSCVWGYGYDLLKEINNQYNVTNKNEFNVTYDYDQVIYAASHINIMMSTALSKMIDKTKCIIFLNTPNSINEKELVSKTYSPWIYHEIATTKLIMNNKMVLKKYAESVDYKNLRISHNLELDHLIELDSDTLDSWYKTWLLKKIESIINKKNPNPLDILYEVSN